jgi:hypothetical protein
MPQTKVKFDSQSGAVIEVEVSFPGKFVGQAPSSQCELIRLVIDTGSRRTHFPAFVANHLGLPVRGKRQIASAMNAQFLDIWSVDLFIPSLGRQFPRMEVLDSPRPQLPRYHGVLGRDILSLGTLRLDGPAGELELIF